MLIKSVVSILILASSIVIATGQAPDAQKTDADKTSKTSNAKVTERLRDLPLPGGVDLQFLIKELARDMDINVLFDFESFRTPGRRVSVDIKNVTAAEALDYILLQEGLFFEEAGPKTILVAIRAKQISIPQIGIVSMPMAEQLAQYFGVDGGILINMIRYPSPASKAGLKAGDVIVEVDGKPVKGVLGVVRAISDKNENEVILTIIRDRKRQIIHVIPEKGIGAVLQKS